MIYVYSLLVLTEKIFPQTVVKVYYIVNMVIIIQKHQEVYGNTI